MLAHVYVHACVWMSVQEHNMAHTEIDMCHELC